MQDLIDISLMREKAFLRVVSSNPLVSRILDTLNNLDLSAISITSLQDFRESFAAISDVLVESVPDSEKRLISNHKQIVQAMLEETINSLY